MAIADGREGWAGRPVNEGVGVGFGGDGDVGAGSTFRFALLERLETVLMVDPVAFPETGLLAPKDGVRAIPTTALDTTDPEPPERDLGEPVCG